jgi:hypothetical protein
MLTCGNSKLGNRIYNFNLPRISCKHKTRDCEKYCYARRNFWMSKVVINSMARNYKLTKSSEFVDKISTQIQYLKIKNKIKHIRIHSSGDFYSQKYWNEWNKIASQHPDVIFLAYTRNYDIDCRKKVDNFKLYYSMDNSTKKINPTIKLKAYIVEKPPVTKHMLKCPETNSYMCDSKCRKCKYCFLSNMNVTFPRH